jgi:uncharacterized membrane protein YfcA
MAGLSGEHILIALAGAFAAGVINALSGNGSVITLTILTEVLGLPGNIANATNRVGVLTNSIGATVGFLGKRELSYKAHWPYIAPVVIGAVFGTWVATIVSHEQFMAVFKGLMVVMLVVILVKPERWLIAKAGKSYLPRQLEIPAMLVLGFYGGFIQMGMGVFYLAILVLVARLPIIESNMIKAVSVGLFTLVAVIIFAIAGQIVWGIGLLMGAAQFAGGWLSAHYGSKVPGAARVAYGVLVVAVSLSVLKLFGVF